MKRLRPSARLRPYFPELALVLAAVLYGSTFVLVQKSLHHVTPSAFNVLRFALATLVLMPSVARRGWRGPHARPTDSWRTLIVAGSALGAVSLVAYQTQNVGIHHTSTSNASFITGLFVVFTPLIAAVRYRRRPRGRVVIAVGCAALGLLFLTGAQLDVSFGDAITVVTALATVVTGVGCSAIAFSLSAWAQRVIDPERAGVINLLEPIVAGAIGYSIGVRLGVLGYLGAALILVGIVVVERGSHPADAADFDPSRIRAATGSPDLEGTADVT